MPELILGIGIDNMFVMVSEFKLASRYLIYSILIYSGSIQIYYYSHSSLQLTANYKSKPRTCPSPI